MPQSRSYAWSTSRVANLGYVREECWEGKELIYSREIEMAANMVPAYVEARRRVVAMQMEEKGHSFHDTNGVIQ